MRHPSLFASFVLMVAAASGAADAATVPARVESSLTTSPRQARQFAFDGDPETFFESSGPPAGSDHFTIVLDRPVSLKSASVSTGRPDGTSKLEAGALEASKDGVAFAPIARFEGGLAKAGAVDGPVKAIRIKVDEKANAPLVVREVAIESDEPVERFRYPVEIVVESDDPDMKAWVEEAGRICERFYPRIVEELNGDGFKPPTWIAMRLSSTYTGVAEAGRGQITGSVKYFKAHKDDYGAMVHETCHVVQRYRGRGNPGWLVEGVADYVRFFVYEPGKADPVNPRRARYDASYRTTAAFLDYVSRKYDKGLVLKLNRLMREGKYKEDAFRELTGKTVQDLGKEWVDSLPK